MSIKTSILGNQPAAYDLRSEADYRIAKSLTMISGLIRLRAFRGDFIDPQSALLEIADRIDAVGSLHSLLAESIAGTVQLTTYLSEICERGARALTPCPLAFTVTCQPEHVVPFKVALPLGLITAELFSNAVKCADGGSGSVTNVAIVCSRPRADALRYVYQDDRLATLDGDEDAGGGQLGTRLIQSLAERMHGDYVWSTRPHGLCFEVTVPMG